MKTLFLLNMSKSQRLTLTFFPISHFLVRRSISLLGHQSVGPLVCHKRLLKSFQTFLCPLKGFQGIHRYLSVFWLSTFWSIGLSIVCPSISPSVGPPVGPLQITFKGVANFFMSFERILVMCHMKL